MNKRISFPEESKLRYESLRPSNVSGRQTSSFSSSCCARLERNSRNLLDTVLSNGRTVTGISASSAASPLVSVTRSKTSLAVSGRSSERTPK